MLSKKTIEKQIQRELDEREWKKLMNADYFDVFNWMIYHNRIYKLT